MERSGEILQAQKEAFFLEQDVLNAFFHQTYNILPLTYNLYPELLDFMPFLHNTQDEGVNSSMWPTLALPLDNGIKVVHLWHLFNPFQIIKHQGAHSLQVNAKRVHKQMWRWCPSFKEKHMKLKKCSNTLCRSCRSCSHSVSFLEIVFSSLHLDSWILNGTFDRYTIFWRLHQEGLQRLDLKMLKLSSPEGLKQLFHVGR